MVKYQELYRGGWGKTFI